VLRVGENLERDDWLSFLNRVPTEYMGRALLLHLTGWSSNWWFVLEVI